jgi:Arc/MetJ-type ribon-helix-helix transcriptional regulator
MKAITITITLPNSLADYIHERVKEGHFSSVSDYICWLIQEDLRRHDEQNLEQKAA